MPEFQLAQTHLLVNTRQDSTGRYNEKFAFAVVSLCSYCGDKDRAACCCRVTLNVYALPGRFWNPARRALLQYVRNLTSAAERGDSAEVSWFLRKEPADFSAEAFHCVLFAGVVCGHHKTVETILHHQNPKKAALRLPTCTQINDPQMASGGKQPGEQVSFLALAYGWEDYARQYPMSKEESHLRWDRGFCLFGSQHLGLMQLLLEYGVHPA